MLQLINLPYDDASLKDFGGTEGLRSFLAANGLAGCELIYGGREITVPWPSEVSRGYHLTFYSDWLDFYLGDETRLKQKFGSAAQWERFYGGRTKDVLLAHYAADLARAASLGAEYVVFHVSDNSVEESFTYRFEHSDELVIDTACEMINTLLDNRDYPFTFLAENLWWPGFTFTRPEMTERLLTQIHHQKKGIMLDTGHLFCTDPAISSEEAGCACLSGHLKAHGPLADYIRGVHLHQSVSGAYTKQNTGKIPKDLSRDYFEQFGASYRHVGRIDTHQPFHSNAIKAIITEISPDYLVHELSAHTRDEKERLLQIQQKTLGL